MAKPTKKIALSKRKNVRPDLSKKLGGQSRRAANVLGGRARQIEDAIGNADGSLQERDMP